MRALTLTQPWATLVAIGAKSIETRSWSTSFRGSVAIHAAKGWPRAAMELVLTSPFREALRGHIQKVGDLPRGAVIATARIVDVERVPACSDIRGWLCDRTNAPNEDAFGDYTAGRYAWLLAGVEPLAEPIPCKGALGLWLWDEDGQSPTPPERAP